MTKTPEITWNTKAYGWEGTLLRLNRDRHNYDLPASTRQKADETYWGIIEKLKDRTLMGLRERLIKASLAGDLEAQNKIAKEIRAYSYEDPETGL